MEIVIAVVSAIFIPALIFCINKSVKAGKVCEKVEVNKTGIEKAKKDIKDHIAEATEAMRQIHVELNKVTVTTAEHGVHLEHLANDMSAVKNGVESMNKNFIEFIRKNGF